MNILERIYDAYPSSDLLAVERGKMPAFANDCGDGLFCFLCSELADPRDPLDAETIISRIDSAMNDLASVRQAFAE